MLSDPVVSRRSVLSQYSANRSSYTDASSPNAPYARHAPSQYSDAIPSPTLPQIEDYVEDLSQSDSQTFPSSASSGANSYFSNKPLPPSATLGKTVAYGPDQMLAVYAARAANAKTPPGSAGSLSPVQPFGQSSIPLPAGAGGAGGAGSISKKGGMKILTSFGKKTGDGEEGGSPVGVSPSLKVPPVVMTRQRSGTVGRGGQLDDVGQAQ